VVTAVAVAVTPEPGGWSATVTFAGEIVPDGNPEPVTLKSVKPTWPTVGDVLALSVTVVAAATVAGKTPSTRVANTVIHAPSARSNKRLNPVDLKRTFAESIGPRFVFCRMLQRADAFEKQAVHGLIEGKSFSSIP
jgi:hypothetical protein